MQNEDSPAVEAIKNTAGQLNDLSISAATELWRPTTAFGVSGELAHVGENTLNERRGRNYIF